MPNDTQQETKAFDATDVVPVSNANPGAETQSLWRTLNTSALSTPIPGTGSSVQGWFDVENEHLKQIVENERNNAHPVRAALAETYYQTQKGVTDTVSGLLTPLNTALGVVTGGTGVASKALKTAAGVYFAWRASQEIVNGRLPDESTGDVIRRKALAGLQLAGSAGAADTGIIGMKTAAHAYIQNSMGLSGDLANKVQAKVEQVQEIQTAAAKKQGVIEGAIGGASKRIQSTADSKISAIESDARAQIGALQNPTEAQIQKINDAAKSQIDAVQKIADNVSTSSPDAIKLNFNAIKEQAAQVIAQENAKFNIKYAALNEKAKAPVTTVSDLKTEIINDLKAEGVQDTEIAKISPTIFSALPKGEVTDDLAPTAAVNTASQLGAQLRRQGLAVDDVRSALANLGYVPRQVQTAVAMVFPDLPKDASNVSYEMTRRVKTDLWQASQSAKDADMQRGLSAAQANVGGIRGRYAEAQGFGAEHHALDSKYMKFKRDLGSSTMSDFTYANEFADQNTILKQAESLIDPKSGEALRGLLDLAGVDTTPLKEALNNKDTFSDLPSQALPDIKKYATDQTNQINSAYDQSVKQIQGKSAAEIKAIGGSRDAILSALKSKRDAAISNLAKQMRDTTTQIGENNPIIAGKSDLALAGKTGLQIRKDALTALGNNAKKSGITNPYAFTQIMYGVAQLGFGSMFGVLHIGRGLAPTGITNMLRSEGFQNWVAQESGVTPQAMPKFREMISNSAPYLEKMAISTSIAGATNAANQPQPPTTKPTKAPVSEIRISQ